ncbi:MAG: ankyrin repeat domain-containing protein [Pseudomonadota bacterium]
MEFFNKKKHETFEIIAFLENLPNLNSQDLSILERNLTELLGEINSSLTQFSKKDLGIILNSFASAGYKKENLSGLNIPKFAAIINSKISEFSTTNLTYIADGFARLGYDKDELKLDLQALTEFIKRNTNFPGLDAIISLRAFAQMGHDISDFEGGLNKLSHEAEVRIPNLEARNLASLVHSLAKCKMFEKLFTLQEPIIAALAPQIADLSSESAGALLKAQMVCDLIGGKKFFDEELIRNISRKYNPLPENISELQDSIANMLPGKHSEQSVYPPRLESVRNDDPKSVRKIDILYEINNEVYFIEIDGPSHYLHLSDGSLQTNSATKQRDEINKAAIAEIAVLHPQKKFHYLTLSYKEIEEFLEHDRYLHLKLLSSKVIKPNREVENVVVVSEEESFQEHVKKESPGKSPGKFSGKSPGKSAKKIIKKSGRQIEDIFEELQFECTQSNPNPDKLDILISEASETDDLHNKERKSLLHFATENNNLYLVKELEGKVDFNQQNIHGKTALHNGIQLIARQIATSTISKDFQKIFKILVRNTNPALGDENNRTALDLFFELISPQLTPEREEALGPESIENIAITLMSIESKTDLASISANTRKLYCWKNRNRNPEYYQKTLFLIQEQIFELDPGPGKETERDKILLKSAIEEMEELSRLLIEANYQVKETFDKSLNEKSFDVTFAMMKAGYNLSQEDLLPLPKDTFKHLIVHAVNHGSTYILNEIFEKSIDLIQDLPTELRFTPESMLNIFFAKNSDRKFTEFLIETGLFDPNKKYPGLNDYPLSVAIESNRTQHAEVLLKYSSSEVAAAALPTAVRSKNQEMVDDFIASKKFDIDTKNSNDDDGSALFWAVNLNLVGIIDSLLKAGANVNFENIKRHVPLQIAIGENHSEAVRRLLQEKDIIITETTLKIAKKRNHPEILDLIQERFNEIETEKKAARIAEIQIKVAEAKLARLEEEKRKTQTAETLPSPSASKTVQVPFSNNHTPNNAMGL